MKSLLKSCALATLFSLALATTAKAGEQPNRSILNSQIQSQDILIAEDSGAFSEQQMQEVHMLNQMLTQYIEMSNMAMMSMQSPNPEIRKMAQQMLTESNAGIERMMTMRRMMFRPSSRY